MKKIFSFLFITFCAVILFSSCQKDFSVENGNMQIAAGSLTDSLGNCLPDTVIGTFYDGVTPGADTAYVEIQVNVTQTGSYSINSGKPENGLIFSDSGFFSNTGINTIRLKPIGTPILPTSTLFTISFDSSFCSFTVNVQDSTGTGLGGQPDTTGQGGDPDSTSNSWNFTQGSFTFAGVIDSATKDNLSVLNTTSLSLYGSTFTADTTISIKFVIPASDIQTGTYVMSSSGIYFSVINAQNLSIIYEADGLTSGTDFTVIITAYDTTTKVVQGTFSGNVKDNSGNIVPITNGNFTATVSP